MRATRSLLMMMAALAAPAAASAQSAARQSASPRAIAGGTFIFPLSLLTKANLDFGTIAANGAGTAVIDPETGLLSVTGALVSLGGNPRPATFVGSAKSRSVVIIRIPKSPITIRRLGGTETMVVQNFTLQGQDKRALARADAFEFNVGATLVVAAGQAEGVYSGEFDVTMQYP